MNHHVSGSSVDRFLGCTHWAHPDIKIEKRQTPAMANGTRRHAIAERILTDRDYAQLLTKDDGPLMKAAEDLKERCQVIAVEQGYAFDVLDKRVRQIGPRSASGYGALGKYEIPMTIDLIYQDGDDIVVRDWKLGGSGITYQPHPLESGQLLIAAIAAIADGINVTAVEYADDRTVNRATLSKDVLEYLHTTLYTQFKALNNSFGTPEPTPGSHCKWCPLEGSCAALNTQLTETVGGITKNRLRLPLAITSESDALDYVAAKEFVQQYLDRLDEQLKEFARVHPVVRSTLGKPQQYREEQESRTVTIDICTFAEANACSDSIEVDQLLGIRGALNDDDLRVVAKRKGEPKSVFRWRAVK